eukprot:403339908
MSQQSQQLEEYRKRQEQKFKQLQDGEESSIAQQTPQLHYEQQQDRNASGDRIVKSREGNLRIDTSSTTEHSQVNDKMLNQSLSPNQVNSINNKKFTMPSNISSPNMLNQNDLKNIPEIGRSKGSQYQFPIHQQLDIEENLDYESIRNYPQPQIYQQQQSLNQFQPQIFVNAPIPNIKQSRHQNFIPQVTPLKPARQGGYDEQEMQNFTANFQQESFSMTPQQQQLLKMSRVDSKQQFFEFPAPDSRSSQNSQYQYNKQGYGLVQDYQDSNNIPKQASPQVPKVKQNQVRFNEDLNMESNYYPLSSRDREQEHKHLQSHLREVKSMMNMKRAAKEEELELQEQNDIEQRSNYQRYPMGSNEHGVDGGMAYFQQQRRNQNQLQYVGSYNNLNMQPSELHEELLRQQRFQNLGSIQNQHGMRDKLLSNDYSPVYANETYRSSMNSSKYNYPSITTSNVNTPFNNNQINTSQNPNNLSYNQLNSSSNFNPQYQSQQVYNNLVINKAMSVISDSKRSVRSLRSLRSNASIRSRLSRNVLGNQAIDEDGNPNNEEDDNHQPMVIKDDSQLRFQNNNRNSVSDIDVHTQELTTQNSYTFKCFCCRGRRIHKRIAFVGIITLLVLILYLVIVFTVFLQKGSNSSGSHNNVDNEYGQNDTNNGNNNNSGGNDNNTPGTDDKANNHDIGEEIFI